MALFKRKKEDTSESGEKKDAKKGPSMKDLYSSNKKEEKGKEEKKPARDSSAKEKKDKKSSPRIAYKVLIKPLVTEKAGDMGKENGYVFQVALNANKIQVAKAIQEVYGVSPRKVNIIRMKGKKVRFGRLYGKRSDWKKAVVRLPKGKSMNVYEGV